jgi:hypothetical protein
MPIIFCSNKLIKFLGIRPKQGQTLDIHDYTECWNAHLFYLNGRKCLIFMNKASLYSLISLDFLKKDIVSFSMFFTKIYLRQLEVDNLLTSNYNKYVNQAYKEIVLLPTDNDKRVLGSMNESILIIRAHENIRGGISFLTSDFLGKNLNETPWGTLKYLLSKTVMNEIIKNHT